MEIIVQRRERESRNYALGATILFHLLILLGLWWLVMMPPNPPLGAGGSGMTISLGEENLGGPASVPVENVSPPIPQPETKVEENPVVTQDIEEAPVIIEKKKEVRKKSPHPVTSPLDIPETPRKPDERALFKKKTTTPGESGFGKGDAPGNEGRADGDLKGNPDGTGKGDGTGSGTGNGTGNGIGDETGDGVGTYELTGRSMSNRPNIEDNSRETGKVVVQIVVDRNGKVIRATAGYKGSTTLHPTLLEKSRSGAMQARFSSRPDAPEEQYGTITFIFKFKP